MHVVYLSLLELVLELVLELELVLALALVLEPVLVLESASHHHTRILAA